MKYWFYSEGNILGPYDPAEMLALPAFSEESLVCAETANGDNADDWKSASVVGEIAAMMGSGRAITSSVAAGAYRLENPSSYTASGFDEKEAQPSSSYSDLLDTIDNILGTRKEEPDPTRPQPTDYDLAEKFDIRLSRIQEELEAARWEKNLLLEKMRMKEMEEKKNRARINELEARLKGELRSAELNARELEQVRHLTDITERSETIKKIEEIKREERTLEKYLVPEREGGPEEPPSKAFEAETKTLKTISPSAPISLKRMPGLDTPNDAKDTGVAGHKLKSLGQTQPPAYVYGAKPEVARPADEFAPKPQPVEVPKEQSKEQSKEQPKEQPRADAYGSYRETPLPGPEAAPAGAYKGFESYAPLPQQAGGLVYDFTVVTPRQDGAPKPEGTSQQFKIEAWPEQAPSAAPAPSSAPAPAPAPVRVQQGPPPAAAYTAPPMEFVPLSAPQPLFQQPQVFNPSSPQANVGQSSSFSPSVAAEGSSRPPDLSKEPAAPAAQPDKTQRLSAEAADSAPGKAGRLQPPDPKGKAGAAAPLKSGKKGGKTAFLGVIATFGVIAIGGLGYFFMGDGVSFSQLTMMNFSGARKTPGAAAQVEVPDAAAQGADQPQAQQPVPEAQPAQETQPAPEAQPVSQEEPPAAEKPSNKNIHRALEIVKSYKLAGGRGSIASWFANSFLSGGAGGANEEWTATPLHGDTLVVQYRLLRPKQEPMIYQFEVDAAKGNIVRGINNNAIELLDASRERTVSAAPVKKALKQKPAREKRPVRTRDVSILPLPDEPSRAGTQEQDPTGFEQPDSSDKVKYLKAQESDEELF